MEHPHLVGRFPYRQKGMNVEVSIGAKDIHPINEMFDVLGNFLTRGSFVIVGHIGQCLQGVPECNAAEMLCGDDQS